MRIPLPFSKKDVIHAWWANLLHSRGGPFGDVVLSTGETGLGAIQNQVDWGGGGLKGESTTASVQAERRILQKGKRSMGPSFTGREREGEILGSFERQRDEAWGRVMGGPPQGMTSRRTERNGRQGGRSFSKEGDPTGNTLPPSMDRVTPVQEVPTRPVETHPRRHRGRKGLAS